MKEEWGILSLIFSSIALIMFIISISYGFLLIGSIVFSLIGFIFGIIQKRNAQTTYGKVGYIMGILVFILSILFIFVLIYLASTIQPIPTLS